MSSGFLQFFAFFNAGADRSENLVQTTLQGTEESLRWHKNRSFLQE